MIFTTSSPSQWRYLIEYRVCVGRAVGVRTETIGAEEKVEEEGEGREARWCASQRRRAGGCARARGGGARLRAHAHLQRVSVVERPRRRLELVVGRDPHRARAPVGGRRVGWRAPRAHLVAAHGTLAPGRLLSNA